MFCHTSCKKMAALPCVLIHGWPTKMVQKILCRSNDTHKCISFRVLLRCVLARIDLTQKTEHIVGTKMVFHACVLFSYGFRRCIPFCDKLCMVSSVYLGVFCTPFPPSCCTLPMCAFSHALLCVVQVAFRWRVAYCILCRETDPYDPCWCVASVVWWRRMTLDNIYRGTEVQIICPPNHHCQRLLQNQEVTCTESCEQLWHFFLDVLCKQEQNTKRKWAVLLEII